MLVYSILRGFYFNRNLQVLPHTGSGFIPLITKKLHRNVEFFISVALLIIQFRDQVENWEF
jgi:hypothetical protein